MAKPEQTSPRVCKPAVIAPGCWAIVTTRGRITGDHPRQCGNEPRPGRLTCRRHADREEEAQVMKAEMERVK